jgi:aspartyl-tRNA(Asn)/glutamyl-tRNA(Gln) amidotransferase subunit C
MVETINAVDVSEMAPLAHPQDMAQRLRQDKITEKNEKEKFQSVAPLSESGLYLVPKVIE